eukprot:3577412-Amphidinium_carterae.1
MGPPTSSIIGLAGCHWHQREGSHRLQGSGGRAYGDCKYIGARNWPPGAQHERAASHTFNSGRD